MDDLSVRSSSHRETAGVFCYRTVLGTFINTKLRFYIVVLLMELVMFLVRVAARTAGTCFVQFKVNCFLGTYAVDP